MVTLEAFDVPTILGGVIVVLTLAFLRFGDWAVDFVSSYRTSPVDAVEESFAE